MDGIDRYEAQSIARDEARAIADEIRRDLEYGEITALRRELESVRRDLHELREQIGAERIDRQDAIEDLRAGLRTLDAMRLEG